MNRLTYSDDHKNAQVDEDAATFSEPIGDDLLLLYR